MSFVTLKEAMPSFIKVFCLVGEHESNDIVYCIDNEHCINYYIHKAILEFEANVKHYILQRGETYEIEKLKTHHILRDAYKICKEVAYHQMKVTDSKPAPDILAHVISKCNCNLICFDTKPSLNNLSEYISHAISLMLLDFMVPSYAKASLIYNKSLYLVYAKNSIPRIETILEKMVLNIKDQEYWIGDVYEIKKLSNPINEYNNIICSIFDDETSATTETVEEKENPVLSEKKKKEIIGKTFKEVNDCVRERLANAISLCASGSDYAVLESVLFDVGYIKKVNAHKAFLEAISAWELLPKDPDFLTDLWNQIKQKYSEMTNNGQSDNDMRKYNQLKDCFKEKQNLN